MNNNVLKDDFHGLKLLAHCGGGAFGDVYYCEDISGKKMAVKIISKKKLGDSWERELRGVSNYRKITENAPGLLQIFHVEQDDGTFFYTMEAADSVSDSEYIPDTLAYRLRSGAIPQDELYNILSGVFNGIKLIHDSGFAHRDIKPDNILFVKGVPKIADIGLLSSLSTTMTQLAGTFEFIPPEERTAESIESSSCESRQRNDLYAFGKVVYCAVTGNSPHEYPSTPPDMPLTPVLKYFLRLSFEMCTKEPEQRMDTISSVAQELSSIKHKLRYGESFRDKLSYNLRRVAGWLKTAAFSSWRLMKRYWYLMLLLVLLGGGAVYWYMKPYDVTKVKNKEYYNKEHKISMKVPYHWEIISKETFQNMMNELYGDRKNARFTQKQLDAMLEALKNGQDSIFCDFDEKFADNVMVVVSSITEKEFEDTSEDEFRVLLKSLYEGNLGFKTEIFSSRKTKIAGHQAILFEFTYMPGIRVNTCLIALKNKGVTITLTAKDKTYPQRQAEFNSVIQTLKIGK